MVNVTNLPYPKNLTGLMDIVDKANFYTNYAMGPISVVVVFVIAFFALNSSTGNRQTKSSITSSLWITSIWALFISLLPNMLDGSIVIGLFIITGFSTLLLAQSKS